MKFSKPKLSIKLKTRLHFANNPFINSEKWNFDQWKIKNGFLIYKGKIHHDCTLSELDFLISWQCFFDKNIMGEITITDKNQQHYFIFLNKKLQLSNPELVNHLKKETQPKINFGMVGLNLDANNVKSNILLYSLMSNIKRGFHGF